MEKVINDLNKSIPQDGETYVGNDGLLRCIKCGGKRQTRIDVLGRERVVNCICECMKREREALARVAELEEKERQRRICFRNSAQVKHTFENDKKNDANTATAQKYVDNFEQMKEERMGLLFYGTVGTSKSFTASCIANALIDKGYKVKFANLVEMVNDMAGMFSGKQEYIASLNNYDLVIYDDLGVERNTEYMQEQVFSIIDSRYRSGKPFIVTTNLTADELKHTSDIRLQRVYDRVLERCVPVKFEGQSIRHKTMNENYKRAKEVLGL